jgi:hypothetical protein
MEIVTIKFKDQGNKVWSVTIWWKNDQHQNRHDIFYGSKEECQMAVKLMIARGEMPSLAEVEEALG